MAAPAQPLAEGEPGTPGVPDPNTASGCCLSWGLRSAPLQSDHPLGHNLEFYVGATKEG